MTKLWSRRTDLETEWKILYPNSGKPDWFCTFVKAICCAKPDCLNTFMYNNLFLLLFDISLALISNILFQFWLLVISSRGLQFMKGRFSFLVLFLYTAVVLWLFLLQEQGAKHHFPDIRVSSLIAKFTPCSKIIAQTIACSKTNTDNDNARHKYMFGR